MVVGRHERDGALDCRGVDGTKCVAWWLHDGCRFFSAALRLAATNDKGVVFKTGYE